jgi:hypothetical protein
VAWQILIHLIQDLSLVGACIHNATTNQVRKPHIATTTLRLLGKAWRATEGNLEVIAPGTPHKISESVIFGTLFFLKMSVVRFLELITKIGIAKIGIPIRMDR